MRVDPGTIKFSLPENMVNSLSANTSVQNGSNSSGCTHDQRVRDKFMLIGFQQEQVMNGESKGPLVENIVFL